MTLKLQMWRMYEKTSGIYGIIVYSIKSGGIRRLELVGSDNAILGWVFNVSADRGVTSVRND